MKTGWRSAIVAGLACWAPGLALADTLLDAIRFAYQTNPTLRGQRADLRSTDEGYVQARAGHGLQVGVSGQVAYQGASVEEPASLFSPATTANFGTGTGSVDFSVTQPIYTGGAARAQIRGAEASVFAGREALRQAESQTILAVITAYMDVRRDRQTVRSIQEEIGALRAESDETQAKGRLGVLSKTDVALTDARVLSSQAELAQAQGRLNVSNAEYLNVVGEPPGELAPESALPGLPATVDEAFDAASHNNPQLLQAMEEERAARDQVDQAKAAYGPTISVKFDAAVQPTEPYLPHQYDRNLTGAVVFNQPLFTSGYNTSKVRQAADEDAKAELAIEAARRAAIQQVAQAWSQLAAARSAIALEARQVDAETAAAIGSRIEERAGLRTTFDMLNVETELLNSQISLIQSQHDAYVSEASLLAAIGFLEARYLAPGIDLYRPEAPLKSDEAIGEAGWEDAVGALDRGILADTSEPKMSSAGAGGTRPSDLPALPPTAP